MRRNTIKRIGAVVLLIIVLNLLGGCGVNNIITTGPSKDLMTGVNVESSLTDTEIAKWMENEKVQMSINDFSVSLLKNSLEEGERGNLLISPLSVLYAMSMCSNGADELTRTELLTALIKGDCHEAITCGTRETPGDGDIFDEWQERLNCYLGSYLHETEGYKKNSSKAAELHIANSIWMKNDEKLKVEESFLKTNGEYYNAGVFKSDFDEAARKQINDWIEKNTKGLIKDMLDEIPESAIMYLVNALGFEAEWSEPYYDYDVHDGIFHGEQGDSEVKYMHSSEWGYLEDEYATGFIKRYAGSDYGFVGLLPNRGVSVDEYIEHLTGSTLYNMLTNISDEDVITSLPQFESNSALSLVDTFKKMGVNKAFSVADANFTKLGTYEKKNILIGRILHNTYIKVDQLGTKAGAATIVEMNTEGAIEEWEPPKEVHLDRPFIYMIIDTNQNIPLFMGIQRDI